MTRKSQKQEERFYLDRFLEAMQVAPDHMDEGEPPDFVVTIRGRKIAVEVKEFHSNATGGEERPRRAVEEDWLKLQALIEQEREHYPELDDVAGYLIFKELRLPPLRMHCQFVKELLGFARSKLKCLTQDDVGFDDFGEAFLLLGEYLESIDLRKIRGRITWEWNYDVGEGELSEDELLKVVTTKLAIQRSGYVSENWLLIVSGRQLSQFMGLPDMEVLAGWKRVNEALRGGPYDRVYLFQYMYNRVMLWRRSANWAVARGEEWTCGA